jgi:hypothetical protein
LPVAWHAAASAMIAMAITTQMPARLRAAFIGASSAPGTCDADDVPLAWT